jgi:hypothetical protein
MAFEVSGLNACVQKMKERAVSLIAETFNAPCRMAMIEDPDHSHITIQRGTHVKMLPVCQP